jgi:hypothetical protein
MKIETMTVGELKAYLDEFPDDKPVGFAYPSGDHWRTKLFGAIQTAEYANVNYSSYHQRPQVLTEEENDEGQEVLILG